MLAWHSFRSWSQARRTPGFLGGYRANETIRSYWTVTVWADESAMRLFRNGGAHMTAMPKLLDWCDEAAFAHWTQPGTAPPAPPEAVERMRAEGRLSKVRRPSAAHRAGRIAPEEAALRPSQRLHPAGDRTANGTL